MRWGGVVVLVLCVVSAASADPLPPPPPPPDAPLSPPPAPPPSPPPAPEPRAPMEPEGVPNAALQSPNPFELQKPEPASSGAVGAAIILGVPLTWLAATIPAFGLGALGFLVPWSAIGSSNAGPGSTTGAAAIGIGIGAIAGIAITYALFPALMKAFGDDSAWVGDASAGRDEGWRLGKWALVAMYTGLAVAALGGFMDPNFTGAGNAISVSGFLIAGVSYVVAWVLDVVGVVGGYNASRHARNPPAPADALPALPSMPPP